MNEEKMPLDWKLLENVMNLEQQFKNLHERILSVDFLGVGTAMAPLTGTALASGTGTAGAGEPGHPGILNIRSSASANSGYKAVTGQSEFKLSGGEEAAMWFKVAGGTNAALIRFGFFDGTNQTIPTNGAYIQMDEFVVSGRMVSAANAGEITTPSTYTITSLSSWYKVMMSINAAGTAIWFGLFNDAGVLLWSDVLTDASKVPINQFVGAGVICTSTYGSSTYIIGVDRIELYAPYAKSR